jgi:hypothetical protein
MSEATGRTFPGEFPRTLMPPHLPCPNPACGHMFPPEAVQGTAALICPRCGTTFRFRTEPTAPPAQAAKPKKPAGKAVKKVTPAAAATRPVPPVPPPAAPDEMLPRVLPEPPTDHPLAPPPDFAPPRLARHRERSRGWIGRSVFLGAAVVLVALLALLGWQARRWLSRLDDVPSGELSSTQPFDSTAYNFRFQPPPAPWKPDLSTRLGLKTGLAFRRTEPNAWMALLYTDYKDHTPTDGELVEGTVRRLKDFFKEGLEWEPRPDGDLAGQPARRLAFVGRLNGVDMTGAADLLPYKGIGYAFVIWAPSETEAAVAVERDGLRRGFTLGQEREGWAVPAPKERTLTGGKAAYTLRYVEGIWERQDNPTAYDPAADAALLGRDPSAPKDADKNGTAVVLALPKEEGLKAAVRAARAHLLAQERKLYPDCTLEDAGTKPKADDRPPDRVGNRDGRLLRLRLQIPDANERFVYLAVVPGPRHVVAVWCECAQGRRVYWNVHFAQLVRTFRLSGE